MLKTIYTIGVYGFSEELFFQTLQKNEIDVVCDVRQRRGVRGSTYAFANSRRLQSRLTELGVAYIHRKDLAPTNDIRALQKIFDKREGVKKRTRTTLTPSFIQAYQENILSHLDVMEFVESLPFNAQRVALLCVERYPEACHRSLLAQALSDELNLEIIHLKP